jgi:DNA-binding transcriptional regulator YbjK
VDDGGKEVPPTNQQRRNDLTDAALEIVARDGLHGLSHRAVDEHAEVPRGTTSNYFRSREALVVAIVQRIVDLHFALIEDLRTLYKRKAPKTGMIDLLGDVVDQALNRFPERYLALFELALESRRKPELRLELERIVDEAMKLTYEAHRGKDSEPSQEDIELLSVFYNGVLFTSLVMPQALGGRSPGEITRTMLHKVLASDQTTRPSKRRRRT